MPGGDMWSLGQLGFQGSWVPFVAQLVHLQSHPSGGQQPEPLGSQGPRRCQAVHLLPGSTQGAGKLGQCCGQHTEGAGHTARQDCMQLGPGTPSQAKSQTLPPLPLVARL